MARTTFRSDAGAAVRALLVYLFSFLPVCPSAAVGIVERAWPVEPPDGSAHDARPVFRIGYEAPPGADPRRLRLRLTVDPVSPGERGYVFDGGSREKGWLQGDEGELLYRHREPLADGFYRWRVWTWNGVAWAGGEQAFELRIDSVAPAEVEGLTVEDDPALGRVLLRWDPVALDREGRPEYVARYHVFRYERRGIFRGVRAFEIGTTVQPGFVDEDPPAGTKLLFYKVTAEDEAGNVAERPR